MAAKVTLDACSHTNPILNPMYVDFTGLNHIYNHYTKLQGISNHRKSSLSRISVVSTDSRNGRRKAVGYRANYAPRWRIYSFSKELESVDNILKDTRSARSTGCDFCQHPCTGSQAVKPCEVSLYLEAWQKDMGKPVNFDAFHAESHGSGIGTACYFLRLNSL